jgi:hypothetical protein
MKNCPRCNYYWENRIHKGCGVCDTHYYEKGNVLDWHFIIGENKYFLSWYFNTNKCHLYYKDLSRIDLHKMLPLDISLEQIEKYLILI